MHLHVVNCSRYHFDNFAIGATRTLYDLAHTDVVRNVLDLLLTRGDPSVCRRPRLVREGEEGSILGARYPTKTLTLYHSGIGSGDTLELHLDEKPAPEPRASDPSADFSEPSDSSE